MNGTIALEHVLRMETSDCLLLYSDDECHTVADVLARKRTHPGYEKLVHSIELEGMRTPILICEGRCVCNGLHRIAAAVDLNLTEIPWTDDITIGFSEDADDQEVAWQH